MPHIPNTNETFNDICSRFKTQLRALLEINKLQGKGIKGDDRVKDWLMKAGLKNEILWPKYNWNPAEIENTHFFDDTYDDVALNLPRLLRSKSYLDDNELEDFENIVKTFH